MCACNFGRTNRRIATPMCPHNDAGPSRGPAGIMLQLVSSRDVVNTFVYTDFETGRPDQ